VTGAADDDPSGIATYSQVGAQFGYGLAWTMLFSFPLMAVIQAISARIGCVRGKGIANNLRRHYPAGLLHAVVALLVIANVINLGADLGAMAALALMIGGPEHLYTVLFGIVCILPETLISYARCRLEIFLALPVGDNRNALDLNRLRIRRQKCSGNFNKRTSTRVAINRTSRSKKS
jgi:Mn2+/Fe2+ NRAMP family transporter